MQSAIPASPPAAEPSPAAVTGDSPRRHYAILAAVVVAGLAFRALLMLAIWRNGGSPLLGDEGNYIQSALPLAEGRGIPDLWLWIRAPGFIFFAAAIFAVANGSLLALNIAQVLLFPAICLLAYFLGTATTDEPSRARHAGLWAAAAVAFNPLLILSDNFFLSEPLYLLLVALLFAALVMHARAWRSGRGFAPWAWLAGAGIVAGLGMLTRPNLQIFLPFAALWLLFLHRASVPRAIAAPLLFGVFALLTVLPWSLYNTQRYGHFIFIDTVGAYVLYLDNTDLSPAEVNGDLWRFSNQGERQQYALQRGTEWIASHKREFARLTAVRIATSWALDPFTDLRYPVRDKLPGTAPVVRDGYAFAATAAYLLATALALAGLFWSPRSDLRTLTILFIVAYALTIGLSNNEFRYRIPVLGVTSAFAGYAMARGRVFWPFRSEGRWRWPAVAAAVLASAFALISLPLVLPGLTRAVQARAIQAESSFQGAPDDRATKLEFAAKLDRVYSAPLREAAQAWEVAGQSDRALDDYKAALAREPGDWRAAALLAMLFRDGGRSAKSEQVAASIPPTFNSIMLRWAWQHARATRQKVTVGADDIGWVRGFHVRESSGGDGAFTYRWSESHCAVKLAPAAGDRRVILRARALPGSSGEPLAVRWAINGAPGPALDMDGQWRDYSLVAPKAALSAPEWVVSLSANARRASIDDPRELAIALAEARTSP